MVAKLGQGLTAQQVAHELHCAPSTVVGASHRFLVHGTDGLLDQRIYNERLVTPGKNKKHYVAGAQRRQRQDDVG
jgi:hypothetical protein